MQKPDRRTKWLNAQLRFADITRRQPKRLVQPVATAGMVVIAAVTAVTHQRLIRHLAMVVAAIRVAVVAAADLGAAHEHAGRERDRRLYTHRLRLFH